MHGWMGVPDIPGLGSGMIWFQLQDRRVKVDVGSGPKNYGAFVSEFASFRTDSSGNH